MLDPHLHIPNTVCNSALISHGSQDVPRSTVCRKCSCRGHKPFWGVLHSCKKHFTYELLAQLSHWCPNGLQWYEPGYILSALCVCMGGGVTSPQERVPITLRNKQGSYSLPSSLLEAGVALSSRTSLNCQGPLWFTQVAGRMIVTGS